MKHQVSDSLGGVWWSILLSAAYVTLFAACSGSALGAGDQVPEGVRQIRG